MLIILSFMAQADPKIFDPKNFT
jgi:hypothetical protein